MKPFEINRGVIEGKGLLHGWRDTDYLVGTDRTLPYEKRLIGGDWLEFAKQIEGREQKKDGFDCYGCVSYSGGHKLRIQSILLSNKDLDINPRFNVVMSGTIPDQGNWLWKVGDSYRQDGWLTQEEARELYPDPKVWTKESYYKPPPIEAINKAKEKLEVWNVGYERIDSPQPDIETLLYHLEHSPLWVTTHTHALVGLFNEESVWNLFNSYKPHLETINEKMLSVWKLVLKQNNMPTDKQLNELWVASFGRPIDPAGLEHWRGKSWDVVLEGINNSEEKKMYNPVFQSVKKVEEWAKQ